MKGAPVLIVTVQKELYFQISQNKMAVANFSHLFSLYLARMLTRLHLHCRALIRIEGWISR